MSHTVNKTGIRSLFFICMLSVALVCCVNHPAVPYNVRELFIQRNLLLGVSIFSLFILWSLGAPLIIERLVSGPKCSTLKSFLTAIVLLPLFSSISWLLLRYSVSTESLWDILGYPIWGEVTFLGLEDWELYFRALPLLTFLLWLVLSVGLLFSRASLAPVIVALGAPILYWCQVVVFDLASTDNVTELFNEEARGFYFLLCSIGLVITHGITLGRVRSVPAALLVFGFTPLTFLLVRYFIPLALTQEACQFLLGPNRDVILSPWQIDQRLALFFGVALIAVALSQYSFYPLVLRGKADVSPRQ